MHRLTPLVERLNSIPNLTLRRDAPLSEYTRFGVGGPADLLVEASDEGACIAALQAIRAFDVPMEVIAGGTNLIVSDAGFRGVALRFIARRIEVDGCRITADAGAVLQTLVDVSVEQGLENLHTMTGVPGSVGAAVYGNAGAYGHSISESVIQVRFYDGQELRTLDNSGCEFQYRESIFKRRKDWLILTTEMELPRGDADKLRETADGILKIRNEKYPPTMKCAGSIFKNLLFRELPVAVQEVVPSKVVREGKVPSAWFLEQVGAKGLWNGGIHVADYHANLIYNARNGSAREVREVIRDLKQRVQTRFGFSLEEEVQYVGFPPG